MKYLIGNWKMNLGPSESLNLVAELITKMSDFQPLEVVICPSLLALVPVFAKNKDHFSLGAQNCFYEDEGAFTGEVSARQLEGLVGYCLVGHSERRQLFNENETEVNHKVRACLKNGIKPVLCIGETLNQRQNGETETTLRNQLDGGLMGVGASEIGKILVAYEPVWAIGSGQTPKMDDLAHAVHIIQTQFEFMYGNSQVPVLYGGSVSDENAEEIMSVPQLDGLLVGNSSLNPEKFAIIGEIIKRGSGLTWSQI